jgi:hypothetical protein
MLQHANFLTLDHQYIMSIVVVLYMNIVPRAIMLNCDVVFINNFWKELLSMQHIFEYEFFISI